MMADESIDVIEEEVADQATEDVVEDEIRDADVITVNIDQTLTISGDAADAKAVGDALAAKAAVSDIQSTLSVNGRTGAGSYSIMLNGDNIPAQSDDDEETIADALSRMDSALSDLNDDLGGEEIARTNADSALDGRISAEKTARENADTALGGRITAEETLRDNADTALGNRVTATENAIAGATGRVSTLESHEGFSLTVTVSNTGSQTVQDARITANHYVSAYQFVDAFDAPTGDVLADLTITTMAGSVTVTVDANHAAGSVILYFCYAEGVVTE